MPKIKIEEELASKTQALNQLVRQARHRFTTDEYKTLREEVLRLERLVAKNNDWPYADELLLPGIWTGMIMNCLVFGNELKCMIVFEAGSKSNEFKILEFCRIAGYRLTNVNDEIIAAHSLAGHGLTAYRPFLVVNSPWLKELELIDKSHPQFDQNEWRNTKHYLLCFKNRMFEAIAPEMAFVGEEETREAAIAIALKHLK